LYIRNKGIGLGLGNWKALPLGLDARARKLSIQVEFRLENTVSVINPPKNLSRKVQ